MIELNLHRSTYHLWLYINKISDMEYQEELLKILIPMQHEMKNDAFSEDEDMDETEDVDMTM